MTTLDDDEKLVLIIALSILGAVAFGAFFLVLCDPYLFREEEDEEDEFYKQPSWVMHQVQLQQGKLAQEVYQQPQQQYDQHPMNHLGAVKHVPAPTPPPPTQQREQIVPRTPTIPPPPPPKHLRTQETQTVPIGVSRETQTVKEMSIFVSRQTQTPGTLIAPVQQEQAPRSQQAPTPTDIMRSESQGGGSQASSSWRSGLRSDDDHSEFSSTTSRSSRGSRRAITPGQTSTALVVQSQDIVETVPPDEDDDSFESSSRNMNNQELSNNNMLTIYEAPETASDHQDRGAEEKKERDSTIGERDGTIGDSEVEIGSYIPPQESKDFTLPDEVKKFETASVDPLSPISTALPDVAVLPTTPPEASPLEKPIAVATLIPRYSYKAERQRFIVLNGLILVISACIVSVVVIRFYL